MTAPPPTPDATNQADIAARIDAVVLAVFIAIAVAGLFLVLIGADRTDRLVAPSSDVGHTQLAETQAPASRSRSSASAERSPPPRTEPAHYSLNNQQDR
jgi:hypothetical protein